jgi:hypothetical protein
MQFKVQSESGEPHTIDAESPTEAAEAYAQFEFDQGDPFNELRVTVEGPTLTGGMAVHIYTVLVDMSPTFSAFPFGANK